MKSSRTFLIVAVLTLVLAAILGRSSAQAPNPPARLGASPTRVAVCDVAAIFNKCSRIKDLNAQFTDKRKAIADEDEKRGQKIQQLQKVLEALRPGSQEHTARVEELEKMLLERSLWRKLQEQTVIRWHRRHTENVYREILTAIAALAKELGYDLVIYRESVDIASQTTTELLNKIAQRKCLYYDPAIDLTEAVLKRVNRRHGGRLK